MKIIVFTHKITKYLIVLTRTVIKLFLVMCVKVNLNRKID